MDKNKLAEIVKEMKLKYNYFSSNHPNKQLRGRLFKFLDGNKIQFLKDKKVLEVKPEDLKKGLVVPADMI